MKLIASLFLISLLFIASCTNKKNPASPSIVITSQGEYAGTVIADTIIYDVIIHNIDPLDEWAEQRLQYVNQRVLIDSIFDLVYQGKLIAYDFFEKRPLKIEEVSNLEKEEDFSRDKIGKIQFAERWYFDASHKRFSKDILSIVLGYDRLSTDSILMHKPVFKIYLNPL